MNQRLAHIAIVVSDYDEAITYYTGKLNFTLVEDTSLSDYAAAAERSLWYCSCFQGYLWESLGFDRTS